MRILIDGVLRLRILKILFIWPTVEKVSFYNSPGPYIKRHKLIVYKRGSTAWDLHYGPEKHHKMSVKTYVRRWIFMIELCWLKSDKAIILQLLYIFRTADLKVTITVNKRLTFKITRPTELSLATQCLYCILKCLTFIFMWIFLNKNRPCELYDSRH